MKDIVFILSSNDFHAMDKYWTTVKYVHPRKVILLTDSIEYAGMPRLINNDANFERLFIIDKFLLRKYTSFGNIWRNLVKLFFTPIQLYRLKKFYIKYPDAIYHATPMYYMFLCYLARIKFIATPQASEILLRPLKSRLYKIFAIKILKYANIVIVDSVNMKLKVKELSGVEALVLKNGFDVSALIQNNLNTSRSKIVSLRGLSPTYRINEILEGRNMSSIKLPITFVYPSSENDYKLKIMDKMSDKDSDLGRLKKGELYRLLKETLLAISIPFSDSSPRSVYECIFAGVIVGVVYSPYIDELPSCMRSRIYLIDLSNKNWFEDAVRFAKKAIQQQYIPTERALDLCDQQRTIKKIIDQVYN